MNIIRNIRTTIMHRAIEANGFVFVGGTIADDTTAAMGEQTRNILGKIAGYLKEAGTDASRVVSASIFVTDMSKKKEMDAAWTEFFGDTADARKGRGRRSRWRRPDRGGGHRAQRLSRTSSQVISRRLAADWHDGQSCGSRRPQISGLPPAVPFREEGRSRVVTNAGWDVVDATASARNGGRRAG